MNHFLTPNNGTPNSAYAAVLATAVRLLICGAIVCKTTGPISAGEGRVDVKADADGLMVSENGKPVLYYQRKTKSLDGEFARAHYIHPLYDLDGRAITEDFPADHRHHRGVFWAWHQVWVGDRKIGDPWTTKDFAWGRAESGCAIVG